MGGVLDSGLSVSPPDKFVSHDWRSYVGRSSLLHLSLSVFLSVERNVAGVIVLACFTLMRRLTRPDCVTDLALTQRLKSVTMHLWETMQHPVFASCKHSPAFLTRPLPMCAESAEARSIW